MKTVEAIEKNTVFRLKLIVFHRKAWALINPTLATPSRTWYASAAATMAPAGGTVRGRGGT